MAVGSQARVCEGWVLAGGGLGGDSLGFARHLLACPPGSSGPQQSPGLMAMLRLPREAQVTLQALGFPAELEDWDKPLRDMVRGEFLEFLEFLRSAPLARRDPERSYSNYLHKAFLSHLLRQKRTGRFQSQSAPAASKVPLPGAVGVHAAGQNGSQGGMVPGVPGVVLAPGGSKVEAEWGPPPGAEGAGPLPPGLVQPLELPPGWLAEGQWPEPGPRQRPGAAVAGAAVLEEKRAAPSQWEEAGAAAVEEKGTALSRLEEGGAAMVEEPLWPGQLAHPRAPPVLWSSLHWTARRDLEAARPAAEESLESHGDRRWSQVWPSVCARQATQAAELEWLLGLEAGQSYIQNAAWVGAFEVVAFRGYRSLGPDYARKVEGLLRDKCRAMQGQNPWGELQLARMIVARDRACRTWTAFLLGKAGTQCVQAAYDEARAVFLDEMLGREAFWDAWLAAQTPGVPGVPGGPGPGVPGVAAAPDSLEPMLDPYALASELRPGIWLLDTAAWPEWLTLGWSPASLAGHQAWSPASLGEPGAVPAGGRAPGTGGSGSPPYYRPALPWQ